MAITTTLINFEFSKAQGLEEGVILYTEGTINFAVKLITLDTYELQMLEAAEGILGPFPVASKALLDDPLTFVNPYNGQTLYESLRYKIKRLGTRPLRSVLDIWDNSIYWDGTDLRRRADDTIRT